MKESSIDEIVKLVRLKLKANEKKVIEWLGKPNPVFCMETPLKMIKYGKSSQVKNYIENTSCLFPEE